MEIIKTRCPQCHNQLEFPRDFNNLICPDCGTAFLVREYKGTISLAAIERPSAQGTAGENEADDLAIIESRLTELDELIAEVGSEVEELRSREQSAPLQRGCAFFGLFMLAITVIAAFMPLGRGLVGHWLFYLALAAAVIFGLARVRRKMARADQPDRLRSERLRLEDGLAQLEAERERILKLKQAITSDDPEPPADSSLKL
jgi:hypothetical protein